MNHRTFPQSPRKRGERHHHRHRRVIIMRFVTTFTTIATTSTTYSWGLQELQLSAGSTKHTRFLRLSSVSSSRVQLPPSLSPPPPLPPPSHLAEISPKSSSLLRGHEGMFHFLWLRHRCHHHEHRHYRHYDAGHHDYL